MADPVRSTFDESVAHIAQVHAVKVSELKTNDEIVAEMTRSDSGFPGRVGANCGSSRDWR
jgi:hypothetical protein